MLTEMREPAGKPSPAAPRKEPRFDVRDFLESAAPGKQIVTYARADVVFAPGDRCDSVLYLRSGGVQLSVISHSGKEAIVGTLVRGDFLGERVLAGRSVRTEMARATMASTVLIIPVAQMIRLLHSEYTFSDRFMAHMLARNARLEADLADHLFNGSEKRLARTLLLLAGDGEHDRPQRVVPAISQETLANMIGTTRSRVSFFLNGFKRRGFVEEDAAGLTINRSIVTVLMRD